MAGQRIHVFDLTKLLSGTHYCTGCAERVCGAAAALDGVLAAECDMDAGTLEVTHDPRSLSARDLEAAVRRIAVEASDGVRHAAYRLTGLD